MRNKLYRLTVKLDANGFEEIVNEWTIVKEGEKTYSVERIDRWGEVSKKMRKKSEIGVISDSVWNNSISLIAYSISCFDEDLPKFKEILKDKVIKTAKNYQATFNKLLKHIQ